MPATLDAREGRLDCLFRPGNPVTVTLTWPADVLDGRSFTGSFGGAAVTVNVAGDVMSFTVSAAQTAAITDGQPVAMLISETGSGVVISGQWTPSVKGSASNDIEATVTVGDVSVDVFLVDAVGLAAALAAETATRAAADTALQTAVDGKQPLDADLTAIAALSTTAFGRALLALADAAALRTAASVYSSAQVDAAITAAVAALVDAAPGTLDTLNELAAALGDDANFASTVTSALAAKQPLDADLTAIAALATTAYGRAFLALADAAAGRTALALGTSATMSPAQLAADAAFTGTFATVVEHGANPAVARPTAVLVVWSGSVEPDHLEEPDLWIDTSATVDAPILVPPAMFGVGAGATAAHLTAVNTSPSTEFRWQVWTFPGTDVDTDYAIQVPFDLPPAWQAVNVDLVWTQTTTNLSGNIAWRLAYGDVGDGDAIAGQVTTVNDVTAAAPAQLVVEVTRLGAGLPVDPTKLQCLTLRRRGTNTTDDTLNGNVGALGLRITRAS